MFTHSSRSIFRRTLPVTAAALAMASGTLAGTPHDIDLPARRMADTSPGATNGMSSFSAFVGVDGLAVFRASAGTAGVYQLWSSSGRVGGTHPIAGTSGVATEPVLIPGTHRVLAYTGMGTLRPLISVDPRTGAVETLTTTAMNASSAGLIFARSNALFLAPVAGVNTLWATDGTAAGTAPVMDSAAGTIGNITPANGFVYFTTRSAANVYTLWRTDGTILNPTRVTELRSPPTWLVNSSGMRAIGDRVLFAQPAAAAGMSEVWVSDGTPQGTTVVTTTPSLSSVLAFPNDGAGLYTTRLLANGLEFWRMSSVAGECRAMMNFARTTVFNSFGTYGSMSLFGDSGGTQYIPNQLNAVTIWVTDGTPENTLGVPGFPGAPASGTGNVVSGVTSSVMAGDTLFLDSGVGGAGHEPWRLNLNTGELGQLRDIIPGGGSSNPNKFFALSGGKGAGFFALDAGTHASMFVSDGTRTGTRIVSRLTGTTFQYVPKSVGSRVFFVGYQISGVGYEPYAVDLCPADYDNSGAATAEDLFAFVTDWFAGSTNADVDNSGGAPDMQDLMGFFNTWMAGCPS